MKRAIFAVVAAFLLLLLLLLLVHVAMQVYTLTAEMLRRDMCNCCFCCCCLCLLAARHVQKEILLFILAPPAIALTCVNKSTQCHANRGLSPCVLCTVELFPSIFSANNSIFLTVSQQQQRKSHVSHVTLRHLLRESVQLHSNMSKQQQQQQKSTRKAATTAKIARFTRHAAESSP